MFLKSVTTINDWKFLMSIIDKYGVDYLIKVFNKLTELHEKNLNLTDYIYIMYGDQRSSNSRFFNDNQELFRKLTKSKLSFNSRGGDIFFCPEKWMLFNFFLHNIKNEIEAKHWSMEKYFRVLNELEKLNLNDVNIDTDDWVYPHSYNTFLTYLASNNDGFMAIHKIYSDVQISIEKGEKTKRISEYGLPKEYPNTIWQYPLDANYKNRATWFLTTDIEEGITRDVRTTLYLKSLATDISKLPTREEIESMNFEPTKVYKIK